MPYLTFKITVQINSLWINQIHFFSNFRISSISFSLYIFIYIFEEKQHSFLPNIFSSSFFLRLLYLCSLTLSSYCFADLIKKIKSVFECAERKTEERAQQKRKSHRIIYACWKKFISSRTVYGILFHSVRTGNRMQNHFAVYWLIRFRIFYSVQKCIATKRNTSCWFFVSFEENFEEEKMRLFKLLNYFVAIMVVTKKRRSPMLRFYAFPMICCLFLIKLFSRQRCAPNLQCML